MSSNNNLCGNISIAVPGDLKFSNAANGDMCIYPDATSQKLLLGTVQNSIAALTLSNQLVSIPQFYSPGAVVQMQYGLVTATNAAQTNSRTYTSNVLNVSITPKFTDSKLLVVASPQLQIFAGADTSQGALLQLRRDNVVPTLGSEFNTHALVFTTVPGINAVDTYHKPNVTALYDANTTNNTTFSLCIAAISTIGYVRFNGNNWGRSDIVVYEIAQ